MKLYHGTTRNRLLSIMQQGLVPKKERGSGGISAVHLTPDFFWAAIYANRKKLITLVNFEPVVLMLEYEGLVEEYTDTLITDCFDIVVPERSYLSRTKLSREAIVGFVTVPALSAQEFLKIVKTPSDSETISTYKNKLKDIYR